MPPAQGATPPATAVPTTAGPSPSPSSVPPPERAQQPPPPRERAFNAPWPVVAWAAVLVAAFLGQLTFGYGVAIDRFALVPIELSAGRVAGLIGHVFLHGGWLHLVLNAAGLLAFGAPVARLLGLSAAGGLRFTAYFVVCGAAGGLAYWALHPSGPVPLIGASGAVYGLVGGAARVIEGRGGLGRPFGGAAVRFLVPWVVLNLLIALAGAALGPVLPIAWEAHLGGLLAGLLLLGAFAPNPPRSKP